MLLILYQAKDRQKKKRVTKGIRVDAEGDVSLEDFTQDAEYEPENATNKKVFFF